MQNISDIVYQAETEIGQAENLSSLDQIRVKYLGKKGLLTDILKQVSEVPPEERPKLGQAINQAKNLVQEKIQARKDAFNKQLLVEALTSETIDITLSGRGKKSGSLHPVLQTQERIVAILNSMGFVVASGPEIEDDYHNFEALNIPEHHPARAMQDTFYFANKAVLRTHMSPVQIRFMEEHQPPFRMIAPGRVYRCDFDATHTPMFHQVEGLLIDKNVSLANLKGFLSDFVNMFFEKELKVRFRPSYFPFTEPSAEMDVECVICEGKDEHCHVCHGSGWLEILGCGMVHPNVLNNVGIDSEKYSGFAFGLGIDRVAMLYYGINDLRLLFENNISFLEQF